MCCLLCAGGCASVPTRRAAAPPLPLPPELAGYYSYPNRPQSPTVEFVGERHGVRESLVRFPLAASGFEPTEPTVEIEWFESPAPGRRPAILLNPILGGDYPLERGIARYFAAHGFHVAMVHRKTLKISPEHPVEHLERLLRQGVVRIRQVVDWMQMQERVDASRMGSFGISMGGMASVMAAAVEPRLRCHVVLLAGGSLADILMTSRDTLLTKPRARYLAHNQIDLPTLERLLRERIKTDPIHLAPYVDSSRMIMVLARGDRTIGYANSLRLWDALGRPRHHTILAGHYTAYLYLPYLKRLSLRFFRDQLDG